MLRELGSRILGTESKSKTYTYRIRNLRIEFGNNGDFFYLDPTDFPKETLYEDFDDEGADIIFEDLDDAIMPSNIRIGMEITCSSRIESIEFNDIDHSVAFNFLPGFFIENQITLNSNGTVNFHINRGHATNRTEGGLKKKRKK